MEILENLFCIILLLSLFTLAGFGIVNTKTAKNNLLLLPVFGYTAILGSSYFISAILKISGATAVTISIIVLGCSVILRIRTFFEFASKVIQNGQLLMFLALVSIPIFSLLLPALIIGFKYFYAYVNYDFFYNSQDSWYLQAHHVLDFKLKKIGTVPLTWSPSFSGRIAISLLGAFFGKWFNLDVLEFNSLLLNTIVIIFALSIAAFSNECYKLTKKSTLLIVFISVMSASYTQAYVYYVLGQISAIPVFVLFCIFLKRFIDSVIAKDNTRIKTAAIILGLLLNVLFILYAIICFFAAILLVISCFISFYRQTKFNSILFILKPLLIATLLFIVLRLPVISESITILKDWISLSIEVSNGSRGRTFYGYLTSHFLSFLFGLINYPSSLSILDNFQMSDSFKNYLTLGVGIGALLVSTFILKILTQSEALVRSAAVIFITLFSIVIVLTFYFFYSFSGYGIFKLQTWFVPLLMPLYVYFLIKPSINKKQIILKTCVVAILALNLIASINYLKSFFIFDKQQQKFVETNGVTRNRDIIDVANKLKSHHPTEISIFLTSGFETAWLANQLRSEQFDKVIHNTNDRTELEFVTSKLNKDWQPSGLLVVTNPFSPLHGDITEKFNGGKIIYQNNSYLILDPSDLKTFIYLGSGAYPLQHLGNNNFFPTKFRLIDKGLEVFIYSQRNRIANLIIELTPGFVNIKKLTPTLTISTSSGKQSFSINSKKTIKVSNIMLRQGLNYITLESSNTTNQPEANLPGLAIGYIGLEYKDKNQLT